MRHHPVWIALLIALIVPGCAYHRSPESSAEQFFDHGRHYILKSLKKQDASRDQIDKARAVLDRNEEMVTQDITGLLRKRQDMFYAITTGRNTASLLSQENAMHQTHEKALRSIGTMHAELESAVGTEMWQAAMRYMEEKMSRHIGK
jgi:hypothetical protein